MGIEDRERQEERRLKGEPRRTTCGWWNLSMLVFDTMRTWEMYISVCLLGALQDADSHV